MRIDEELTLKKLEVFLAFMRSGNLAKAAGELGTGTTSMPDAQPETPELKQCRMEVAAPASTLRSPAGARR